MLAKIKKNYFVIISTLLIFYFLINFFGGNRGFFAYIEKKEKLNKLNLIESNLMSKIDNLEHKNSLLSEDIDEDYVDILIREKLMLGKKGESTYILIDNES
tara:strand:- start:58 stop:360 length:303 start_codon:yes stop_codon:yes gene_type:complete